MENSNRYTISKDYTVVDSTNKFWFNYSHDLRDPTTKRSFEDTTKVYTALLHYANKFNYSSDFYPGQDPFKLCDKCRRMDYLMYNAIVNHQYHNKHSILRSKGTILNKMLGGKIKKVSVSQYMAEFIGVNLRQGMIRMKYNSKKCVDDLIVSHQNQDLHFCMKGNNQKTGKCMIITHIPYRVPKLRR